MKKTSISPIAIAAIFILISGCSLFNAAKRTRVTRTENSVQKSPNGTTETTNVITTETISEKNPKPIVQVANPSVIVESLPVGFTATTDEVTKDGVKITIKAKATTKKQPTSYTQKVDSDVIDNTDPKWDCNVKIVEVNANSSTFMNADYEAQGQHIYPGAVYYYDDFKNGNYKELTDDRYPLQLLTDVPNITGTSWTNIEKPNVATIRDGIAGIYTRFDNRQVGTMNLRYQTFESNTQAEFSLRLSAGASFSGFSLENEYKNTTQSTRHNITIDAIKPLYSITSRLPFSSNYFNPNSKIDYKKNPVVISSVTYGIRVLANFNVETDTKTELDELKARYTGVGTTAHVDFNYLTKEAKTDKTINCYVVGGAGNSTIAFTKEELEKGLKDLVAGVTYATARPISYELQDLAGNIIETESATDKITTRKCVPHYAEPILQNIIVQSWTGGDDKDHDSHYQVYLKEGITGDFNANGAIATLNSTNGKYSNNSFHQETMTLSNNSVKEGDFIDKNGGSLFIHFTHVGDDTWKISKFSVILVFKNLGVKRIDFGGFELSDESENRVLFFNKNFTQIQ